MTTKQDEFINHRIIVIDDNESIHDDFRKVLCDIGETDDLSADESLLFGEDAVSPIHNISYEVDSALQGEAGWNKVRHARDMGKAYAVAFVDMRMPPGWDGLKTVEKICEDDPDIQIVICTAYSDYTWQEITQRINQLDRLLILKKPFDHSEICQLAAALTEKWRLGQQAKLRMADLERMVEARTVELNQASNQLKGEIDDRQAAEAQYRHATLHDPLTDLPNRALLLDRIEHSLQRMRRDENHKFAILFMDLDNFNVINDGLGHELGDQLLMEVSRRLGTCVREVDSISRSSETLARLGGDEFVILLDEIRTETDALRVADRIINSFRERISVGDQSISLSATMGIALGNRQYRHADEILRDADTALNRGKHDVRGGYVIFDKQMRDEVVSRLMLENELRTALECDQLCLWYQPILNTNTEKIISLESLIRWHHPEHGLMSPAKFIPLAEETELIVPLGEWVLMAACRQLKRWHEQFGDNLPISLNVNLSSRQFSCSNLVERIRGIIEAHQVNPAHLTLEVTESVVMENQTSAIDALVELKKMGFRLALDDFGTGYSSLGYLRELPIDVVKIDRSFVRDLNKGEGNSAFIHAMVTLAHTLSLDVVTEGIELQHQLDELRTLESDMVQGFLFSKPLDPSMTSQLIQNKVVSG